MLLHPTQRKIILPTRLLSHLLRLAALVERLIFLRKPRACGARSGSKGHEGPLVEWVEGRAKSSRLWGCRVSRNAPLTGDATANRCRGVSWLNAEMRRCRGDATGACKAPLPSGCWRLVRQHTSCARSGSTAAPNRHIADPAGERRICTVDAAW